MQEGAQTPAVAASANLAERVRSRSAEIERALLTRVYGISDPGEVGEPTYTEGLRAAVSAALAHAIEVLEGGPQRRLPPVPLELLAQARLAARSGIGLDTVLRRYCSGNALFLDFLLEEAEEVGLPNAELKRLLRAQASCLDVVLIAVGEEYAREENGKAATSERRRNALIEGLLAGELIDTSTIDYDFDLHHLGAIAIGNRAHEAVRDLALGLDCRPLLIRRDDRVVWAWLGSRRDIDSAALEKLVADRWPTDLPLAAGEPAQGLAGWRYTHQQARAALSIAVRKGTPGLTRYVDVALLASMLQDDLLCTSLRELFLVPLVGDRDGGAALHETLRAYFAAGRNVSGAAALLGISRPTVTRRLGMIERKLDRPLGPVMREIEAAMQLMELEKGEQ